jgi:hypothetical protein
MKKPKAPSLKKLYEGLQKDYASYRETVRAYIMAVNSVSARRNLMTIEPANEKGMINGLTIPELVMLVNLCEGTGEYIVLETVDNKKNLRVVAKKKQIIPFELF